MMNRGMPGFNVDPYGALHLSLMRSCSGWPSGVWIDPPRRTLPDGGELPIPALEPRSSTRWPRHRRLADGRHVRAGHDYNNPLVARALDTHPGRWPRKTSLLEIEPPSVVLTALKPGGVTVAQGRHGCRSGRGLSRAALRVGGPADCRRRSAPLADRLGRRHERPRGECTAASRAGRRVSVRLGRFEIATVWRHSGARE